MKITRDTPDQLILEYKPWITGIFLTLFTLVFVAIGATLLSTGEPLVGGVMLLSGLLFGGIFFAVFVRRVMVILDAPTGRIEIRRKSVFGSETVEHQLQYLDRAVVETIVGRNSDGMRSKTHRCTLILNGGMSAGHHPLTTAYSSGRGASRAKKAINTWLAQHRG